MYCPKCGTEITQYSKYCRKCGAELPYDKEFDKFKSDSTSGDKGFLSTNKMIIFLCILGLGVIIVLSALSMGSFNQHSTGNDPAFDNFINDNLLSSSDDDGEVEYYYSSGGDYEVSYDSNDNSNFSDVFHIFSSDTQLNQSGYPYFGFGV